MDETQREMSDRVTINSSSPEIMTNNLYTPAFLRNYIGIFDRNKQLNRQSRDIRRSRSKLYSIKSIRKYKFIIL